MFSDAVLLKNFDDPFRDCAVRAIFCSVGHSLAAFRPDVIITFVNSFSQP